MYWIYEGEHYDDYSIPCVHVTWHYVDPVASFTGPQILHHHEWLGSIKMPHFSQYFLGPCELKC